MVSSPPDDGWQGISSQPAVRCTLPTLNDHSRQALPRSIVSGAPSSQNSTAREVCPPATCFPLSDSLLLFGFTKYLDVLSVRRWSLAALGGVGHRHWCFEKLNSPRARTPTAPSVTTFPIFFSRRFSSLTEVACIAWLLS